MGILDFISEADFRKSLEADYAEAESCYKAKAWKAVHVLVGSIVETVLVDYLVTSGFPTRTKKDPLRMGLEELIAACEKEGILSKKAAELSSAIKFYRNLVHPGRRVRLKEVVDENGATVAKTLMHIVLDEISTLKKEKYGYTAEQIAGKLERDPSSLAILPHLLKSTNEYERERLLLDVLPVRYFAIGGETDYDGTLIEELIRLSHCFRTCFDMASEDTKRKVMNNFVSVLTTADQDTVFTYEAAFVKGEDLNYVAREHVPMAKDHLLSRLKKGFGIPILTALEGLEKFLDPADSQQWVDPLIQSVVYGEDERVSKASRKYLEEAYWRVADHDFEEKVVSRLGDWVEHLEKKGLDQAAETVRSIKSSWEVPF